MTVANLRYGHLSIPWDSPLAFGIQAQIEYNGLVMNNRYQEDKICVSSITGLDDAEIRDSRQPRPGEHGEFAYDAFYGGRTIVLTGYIQAGSLAVAKALERDLKGAFAPLTESPLKFRWFDISDNFDDPATILPYNVIPSEVSGNYQALKGSVINFATEGGFLKWRNPSEDYVLRASEKKIFGDVQSTIQIIQAGESSSSFGFIYSVKDNRNYVCCSYNQNKKEPYMAIEVFVEGIRNIMEKIVIPLTLIPDEGVPFYLRGKKEGNKFTVELWDSEPTEFNFPSITTSATLEGTDSEEFGNEVVSYTGFGGNQENTLWSFDNYKIEALYPGDVVFNARKLSSLAIKDEQTSLTRFKRSFQITMRASDFRAACATQVRQQLVPITTYGTSVIGRPYPRVYPLKFRKYIGISTTQKGNMLSVTNKGNVFVEPVIVIYGPFSTLGITNITNGLELYWKGSMPANEFLIIDCGKEKTVLNSKGQNMMNEFESNTSAWLVLEPSTNNIFITGNEFNKETSLVAFYYQHGYM